MTTYKNLVIVAFIMILGICASSAPGAASDSNTTTYYSSDFGKFFYAGGILGWLLMLLSLVTVSLIIQYVLHIRRSRLMPVDLGDSIREHLSDARYRSALDFLSQDNSFLARVLHMGLSESANGRAAMENAMADVLELDTTNLLRRIEWLNIIGNVAPMIGLFGTVWGMIDAFNGIVLAGGQPEPADLAGGISTALVTTWWGMVVAIPALAAYGFLRNRIDALSADVAVAAEEILHNVKPGTGT